MGEVKSTERWNVQFQVPSRWVGHHSWRKGDKHTNQVTLHLLREQHWPGGFKSIKPQTLTLIISPSQSLKAASWRVVELVRDVLRVWEGNPELSTLTLRSWYQCAATDLCQLEIQAWDVPTSWECDRAHCVPALLCLFPPALPYVSQPFVATSPPL